MASADPPSTPLPPRAAERLADTMFALAAPSRLQILACLGDGPLTVSQIIQAVGMEQSAVSHQLRVLREHAIVTVERRGRERLYALRDPHVAALLEHGQRHVLAVEGGDPEAERRRAGRRSRAAS
ncbi:MAG TPA: metalloregulator ArsR/SmtB family transcription factor [Solirubrobacteraceae bacterium]|jgi:DNA-binding transcriptional ArsR family regulator|nr:metalloregulator ArsR/SmtB family transcription factor [Solirubrobacteraceae bacterium]